MQENVTRRPGRPKSEEKAEAIQQAAISLFMADGIERTSMDAIASAAGVSKQTVYSHFNNKDDLFRSCVACKLEMYGLDVSSLEASDDIDVVLKHAGRKYLELLADPGVVRMFRLMASEADTHRDTVLSFYEAGPSTTMRNVAEIVARHLPGGPDNGELARLATDEYLALVRGVYFVELLLGVRSEIAENEMDAHLDQCILQIHKLYELN
jgi:TetR/AcrR family transcriptional repressor of mexJK operon